MDIYDVASNTWLAPGAPMPHGRSNLGYFQTGNLLYAVGGWGAGTPTNAAYTERYDMEANTWEEGPAFTPARADFPIAMTNQYIYAIGGDSDCGGYWDSTNSVWRYDWTQWPAGAWEDTGDPIPTALQAHFAGFTTDAFTGGEVWTVLWQYRLLHVPYSRPAVLSVGARDPLAKQKQSWQPGEAGIGLFSHGYRNTVFDRAVTFTHWLRDEYPQVRLFREVDHEMTAEFLGEKAETCTPDTIRTLLATLKKLQEGLYVMNWIHEDIVPAEWEVIGRNPPRGPYAIDEATDLQKWVETREAEYGQALRFILSSGARIDETLHLRADKIFAVEKRVELIGKGGRVRRIRISLEKSSAVSTRGTRAGPAPCQAGARGRRRVTAPAARRR